MVIILQYFIASYITLYTIHTLRHKKCAVMGAFYLLYTLKSLMQIPCLLLKQLTVSLLLALFTLFFILIWNRYDLNLFI